MEHMDESKWKESYTIQDSHLNQLIEIQSEFKLWKNRDTYGS